MKQIPVTLELDDISSMIHTGLKSVILLFEAAQLLFEMHTVVKHEFGFRPPHYLPVFTALQMAILGIEDTT